MRFFGHFFVSLVYKQTLKTMATKVIKNGKIEMLDFNSNQMLESKKLHLQKKLKTAENKLKKYIKEDDNGSNRTHIMMQQRFVWDLDEQLKELENE